MSLLKDRIGSANKFYCGGRGLSGPDRLAFVVAILMTAVPVAAYLLFEGPWMWSWVSPAVPIVEALLFLWATAFHLITAFTDPGILPRVLEDEEDENPWKRGRVVRGVTRKYMVRGVAVQGKFCTTCQIYRPPRAVHCATCDNCVDQFDHHCPWTGNCVGRRNYKYFLMYVLCVPVLCLFTMGTLVAKLAILAINSPSTGAAAFWEAVTVDPAAAVIVLYTLIPLGFVGFLLCYHVVLTMENRTTNEKIKGLYRTSNPFAQGCLRNMRLKWCGPFRTRYIKMHLADMEPFERVAPPADATAEEIELDVQFSTFSVQIDDV